MSEEHIIKPLFTWRSAVASKHGPVKSTTRHVLLNLGLHMNELGESCFPSTRLQAEETGLSERAVCEHLGIAKETGWIKVAEKIFNGRGWKRHEYRPMVPALARKAIQQERTDGESVPQKNTVSDTDIQAQDKNKKQGTDSPSVPAAERTDAGSVPQHEGTDSHAEGTDPNRNEALTESQYSTSVSTLKSTSHTVDQTLCVFDYWKETMNQPKAVLDSKRRSTIEGALGNYSIGQLKLAIYGCSVTPYNMGDNKRAHGGRLFNDVSIIFKNSSAIEQFAYIGRNYRTTQNRVNEADTRICTQCEKEPASGSGQNAGLCVVCIAHNQTHEKDAANG